MTKNGGLRNICFGEYLLRMSPVEQRPDNTHLLSHSCPTGSSHGPAEKKERLTLLLGAIVLIGMKYEL